MILTKEQVEELWTPTELGMVFESEQDKNNLIETLRSVEAERDEAYKAIEEAVALLTSMKFRIFDDDELDAYEKLIERISVLKCKEGI